MLAIGSNVSWIPACLFFLAGFLLCTWTCWDISNQTSMAFESFPPAGSHAPELLTMVSSMDRFVGILRIWAGLRAKVLQAKNQKFSYA